MSVRYGLKWSELTDKEQQEFIILSTEVLDLAARSITQKTHTISEWVVNHYRLSYDLLYENAATLGATIDDLVQYVTKHILDDLTS